MGYAFDVYLFIIAKQKYLDFLDNFNITHDSISLLYQFAVAPKDYYGYSLNDEKIVKVPWFINTFGKYLFSNANQLGVKLLWALLQIRLLIDHLVILLVLKSYRNTLFNFFDFMFKMCIKIIQMKNVISKPVVEARVFYVRANINP